MKGIKKYVVCGLALVCFGLSSVAQDTAGSSSTVMRRGSKKDRTQQEQPGVTQRMQSRLEQTTPSDADLSWMRVIYRSLDLTQDKNAPLYYPEEPVDGDLSLFRIIIKHLADGDLTAYEYLDGREVFTDQYAVKVKDMLDRFHIYYQMAKGSTEKNPKYVIEESDVPANEVLSYYVIERWEFDNRSNRMRTRVEAICPVLHRSDDFGMESVKYPMFWVKFSDLRPYLSTQNIFTSDANNLATCTLDDYFQLGLYDGEIYKTRNLKNKSMAQLYPDADDRKRAQDSIQSRLVSFNDNLWVPSLEELEAKAKAKEAVKAGKTTEENDSVEATVDTKKSKVTRRGSATTKKSETKPAKVKRAKQQTQKAKSSNSSATRSVRNRKR